MITVKLYINLKAVGKPHLAPDFCQEFNVKTIPVICKYLSTSFEQFIQAKNPKHHH